MRLPFPAVLALLAPAVLAQTPAEAPHGGPDGLNLGIAAEDRMSPEVPFVVTELEVVDAMLALASVGPEDVVYDLGCGDGRIVNRAAKTLGARGVGVDIDPRRVADARRSAFFHGVSGRVEFRVEDLFETDLREATVVALYLLPELNRRLRPRLLGQLRPGARVVSNTWDMGSWKPDRTASVDGKTLLLWTIPEDGLALLRRLEAEERSRPHRGGARANGGQ